MRATVPIQIPVCKPSLGAAELAAVQRVFESYWLSLGQETARFERQLEEFIGVKHVVGVNAGSAALHLALLVLDLKGGEVLVPSLTFVATVQAIRLAGGVPVFCEVDPATLNLDPEDAARRVTPRTRAILPVHYGGYMCDMDAVSALAKRHSLAVVEDAAHAFGSEYRGQRAGSLGNLTCFSFSPVKNITCGEGGAVATESDDQYRRLLLLRNLGIGTATWQRVDAQRPWHFSVDSPGYRYALPNLNAAIGLAQFPRWREFRESKQAATRQYDQALAGVPGLSLLTKNVAAAFPYSYVVRVLNGQRDSLAAHLRNRGIGTAVHYIPNHLQPEFSQFRVELPLTEELYGQVLSLPLYAGITAEEVNTVVAAIREFPLF